MMRLLGKSGVCMALLQSLLFVTIETDTKRAAGRGSGNVLNTGVACSNCRGHAVCALQEASSDTLYLAAPAAHFRRSSVNLAIQSSGGELNDYVK